jgi:dihydrofolate synthase/folylpolyglutamate synthase
MLWAAGRPWSATLEEASRVLPTVRLAGRFQIVGNCVLDVAHNPDGMESLVATLGNVFPGGAVVGVLGILKDKNWREMMRRLAPCVERMVLVSPPSAPPERVWNPVEAESFARAIGIDASFEPDFKSAIRLAVAAEGTSLITGSFHTVGDALIALGLPLTPYRT